MVWTLVEIKTTFWDYKEGQIFHSVYKYSHFYHLLHLLCLKLIFRFLSLQPFNGNWSSWLFFLFVGFEVKFTSRNRSIQIAKMCSIFNSLIKLLIFESSNNKNILSQNLLFLLLLPWQLLMNRKVSAMGRVIFFT